MNFEYTKQELLDVDRSVLLQIAEQYKLKVNKNMNKSNRKIDLISDFIVNFNYLAMNDPVGRFCILPIDLNKILFGYLTDVDLFFLTKINKKFRSFDKNLKIDIKFVELIIRYGYLDLLIYFKKQGYQLPKNICFIAAKYGHLSILEYVIKNLNKRTYILDGSVTRIAAKYNHLECLKYVCENDCEWSEEACDAAANNGRLECLKYLHENECPWDEHSCVMAAENGHLECLKYLHENVCPWNMASCISAARNGHLHILKYIYENGCPFDKGSCRIGARAGKHQHIINWLESLENKNI